METAKTLITKILFCNVVITILLTGLLLFFISSCSPATCPTYAKTSVKAKVYNPVRR